MQMRKGTVSAFVSYQMASGVDARSRERVETRSSMTPDRTTASTGGSSSHKKWRRVNIPAIEVDLSELCKHLENGIAQ